MSPDFRDLIAAFNEHEVEYLVVGAHALAAHGHVRATKDLDIWIRPSRENAFRVITALKSYGAALLGLSADDLEAPGVTFQMGVAPLRIDILTEVDGLAFEEAWSNRLRTKFAGLPTSVLSRNDLIINKLATGRTQDLADVERLRKDQ